MSAQLATYHGIKVGVGFSWQLRDAPVGLQRIKFGARGQGYVSFNNQTADINAASLLGRVPLSWIVGQLIKDQQGISAVVLLLDDGRHFGVHIEQGIPLVEPEHLFDDSQSAMEWAIQSKRSSFADAIYVAADFLDLARTVDTGVSPQVLPEFGTLDEEILEAAPQVQPYRIITNKSIGVAGFAVGAMAAGIMAFPFAVEMFGGKPDAQDDITFVPTVDLAVDMNDFAQNCVNALRDEWPGVPGWKVAKFGCALPGAPRPIGDMNAAVAWKEYERVELFAAIPASGITSARMASYMFQQWPFEERVIEGQILAARPIDMSWQVFAMSDVALPEFRTRVENAFASVLAADLPQTLFVQSDPAQPPAPTFATVTLDTSMLDAFERSLFMASTDVLAIAEDTRGKTTITLDDRRGRLTINEADMAQYISAPEETPDEY